MSDTEQQFFRRTSSVHPIAVADPLVVHGRVLFFLHNCDVDQVKSLIETYGPCMALETLALIAAHPGFETYFDLPIDAA